MTSSEAPRERGKLKFLPHGEKARLHFNGQQVKAAESEYCLLRESYEALVNSEGKNADA
jgi:hypothetical protein